MASIALRDYQLEAMVAVQNALKNGVFQQLLVLPTGSGKTVIMAALAKKLDTRLLLLAHRNELIQQAHDTFKLYWPTVDIGICKGTRNEIHHQIVIGSIQSCSTSKRLQQLQKERFDILMIDEAHHAESKSYQRVIKALEFKGSSKLLVGVTATPERGDKKKLSNTFDKIVFSRSIGSLIRNSYLPPVIGRRILTNFSLKGMRSYHGDFVSKQLASAVNTTQRNQFIVAKYKQYAATRKAIVFCVDVKHCKNLAATFKSNGITVAAVWGAMPRKKRKEVLHDLHTGKIKIVTSCELLIEGFDEETIDAIVMARPTKSKPLYIQMVGRGLRKSPGKENCLVLDFTDTGNNLRNVISLTKAIPEAVQLTEQPHSNFQSKRARYFDGAQQKDIDHWIDMLGSFSFLWIDIGDHEWSLTDSHGDEIIIHPIGKLFIATLYKKNGKRQVLVLKPMARNYCIGTSEDYARKNLDMRFANCNAAWMNRYEPPTANQLHFIRNKGVSNHIESKAQAAYIIRSVIALERKKKRLQKELEQKLPAAQIAQSPNKFLVQALHTAVTRKLTSWIRNP